MTIESATIESAPDFTRLKLLRYIIQSYAILCQDESESKVRDEKTRAKAKALIELGKLKPSLRAARTHKKEEETSWGREGGSVFFQEMCEKSPIEFG